MIINPTQPPESTAVDLRKSQRPGAPSSPAQDPGAGADAGRMESVAALGQDPASGLPDEAAAAQATQTACANMLAQPALALTAQANQISDTVLNLITID